MRENNDKIIKNNVKLDITDLDMNANGIAHLNNKTYFVENAIIGESVEALVVENKKNIVRAKCVNILNASNSRTTPLCPYFYECGGCDLQHIKYNETLNFKKNQILLLLKKIANINYNKNIEILESDNQYYYRNKLSMQIKNNNGVSKLCYYKKNSHNSVFVDNCFIVDKKFKIVIEEVNSFLREEKIESYNEKTKIGIAKHLVARIIDDNLLLTFVTTKNKFPSVEKLYFNLQKHFKTLGINLNINRNDKEYLSNNFIHLIGEKQIKFNTLNISQVITNASFLQVNINIQNKLYNYVLENISNIVVNAYSGAGLLTCLIAKNLQNKKVVGIEINKEATSLADKLKKDNKILNVENICADATKKLGELNLQNYTLVLDPPRSGINADMIKTILQQKPEKIIYISCSLNTLCKNLKDLKEEYNIEEIKGFDMFPQTKNLETVVILKRRG